MITFAVVGHPNKGKSSVVATLAESEAVAISAVPGTTRKATSYAFRVDGETLYELVDTPGFQRAAAVLSWLKEHAQDASDRAAVVRAFVAAHASDPRFRDECELLQPILNGAGILYVVDGSKPYGPEFETDMQILQWTGQPRMALINHLGEPVYLEQWRRALDQYFSIVRVFDAMHADFDARVNLLRAFAELDERWRAPMQLAVAALQAERERRIKNSALEISAALLDCLRFTESGPLADDEAVDNKSKVLNQKLLKRIKAREQRARDAVQTQYHHTKLAREEPGLGLVEVDLFTRAGWELFGLSKVQLLVSGAMTGALAGLGIDALVGGASLLVGAGIGALVGGLGSYFAGDELAKTKVLGTSLGGRRLQVGPILAPNFPWVFIGRAWVHHQLVAERNHALRDALSSALAAQSNLMDNVPEELRKSIGQVIAQCYKSSPSVDLETRLSELLAQLLALPISNANEAQQA